MIQNNKTLLAATLLLLSSTHHQSNAIQLSLLNRSNPNQTLLNLTKTSDISKTNDIPKGDSENPKKGISNKSGEE
jgi:hypothetical protein